MLIDQPVGLVWSSVAFSIYTSISEKKPDRLQLGVYRARLSRSRARYIPSYNYELLMIC
jgi:hypothetical protein